MSSLDSIYGSEQSPPARFAAQAAMGDAPETGPTRQRIALVVGINRFDDPNIRDLRYAVADAVAMGDLLERAGYEVTRLHDDAPETWQRPTRPNIEASLQRLTAAAESDDFVLLYVATHGLRVDDEPRLLFRDSHLNLPTQLLRLAEVIRTMDALLVTL